MSKETNKIIEAYQRGWEDGRANRPLKRPKNRNLVKAYMNGYNEARGCGSRMKIPQGHGVNQYGQTIHAQSLDGQQYVAHPC